MPAFDGNELLDCIKELVKLDKQWITNEEEDAQFYTRMVHFSTDKTLGVRPPVNTKMITMLNPVLLKVKPVSLKCSVNTNKTWPLGHGAFSLGGNLGPLIPNVADAKANGFDDVLWLLDDYITEMTILNVFVFVQSRYGNYELITSPNDGTILNSVNRQTIIDLTSEIKEKFNVDVLERRISIHEVIQADREGRLVSMFGTHTHCPLLNINRVVYRDTTMSIEGNADTHRAQKDFTNHLRSHIVNLMRGSPSHPWVTALE